MVLVYLYHSEVFYGNKHLWSWIFEPIFLTGFFFVSGYLFTSNWESVSVGKKLLQVLHGIVIPYFLFMFAFIMPKIVLLGYDWRQSVSDIFLLRASWFVIAIGVVQMLYAFVLSVSKKTSIMVICSMVFTLIGYGFVLLYRVKLEWMLESTLLHSRVMSGCWPACFNLAMLASPFFAIGMLYRKFENKIEIPASYVLGVVLLAIYQLVIIIDHRTINSSLCFAACSSNNYLLEIFYFIIAITALVALCKKIKHIAALNYIGENTLLFYYLNILMLRVAGMIYNKSLALAHLESMKEVLGYGNYIIVSLLAIGLTFPVVWFIVRFLPILTGKKEVYNNISKKLNLNINW